MLTQRSMILLSLGLKHGFLYEQRAGGYSVCVSRAVEVSRFHARSYAHSYAGHWGKRRRLWNSECGAAAPPRCERSAQPLPDSPQAMDEWQGAYYILSCIRRLSAAKHHVQRLGRLLRIFGGDTALGQHGKECFRLCSHRQLFRRPGCAAAARSTDPVGGRSRPELSALYGAER